jgi:hypothetical protein
MNNTLSMNQPTNTSIKNPILLNKQTTKKSIRFNDVVFVKPFEKACSQEAKDIWYNEYDMASFKKHGREMALSYKNLTSNNNNNNKNKNKNNENTNNDDKDNKDCTMYRGFEYFSIRRQKQKIISNRCVLYAQSKDMNATEIATVYRKANAWSTDVAFVQAVHDYVDIYNSNKTTSTSCNNTVPEIISMIPPPIFPFALQSVLSLRRTGKRRTANNATEQQSRRRVRQRVC